MIMKAALLVEYETLPGVYNHGVGITLSYGNSFDYNKSIRLRERERSMASARAPILTLGSLDPQSGPTDEKWQAGIGMASGHIAVCASLAGC